MNKHDHEPPSVGHAVARAVRRGLGFKASVGVVLGIALLVLVLLLTSSFSPFSLNLTNPFRDAHSSATTSVVESIRKENQIVLLSASVQVVDHETSARAILNWTLPGTTRDQWVRYTYRAKLGIEGRDVVITELDPQHYRIHIPKFITIGITDPVFEEIVDTGGVFSFVSHDIDEFETVNRLQNDSAAMAQLLADNRDFLKEQAEFVYRTLVNAIDPSATVEFTFAE